MGKLSKLLLAVSIVILLLIGSVFLYENGKNTTGQSNLENRFNAPANLQNVEHGKNILQINSIAMGETIKSHLRNDPSISLMKHNKKNESHYNKREVTVKFEHHPSDLEIARMTNDIKGNVVKYLDSTIVFRSNELSTSELIQYFNSQPDFIYAEPNYLYLQNKIDFPNDLLYREQYQWNLPVIQTEAGWDVTRGDEKIIIAVVDTGVDLNHPDLRKRLTKGYNVLENNDYPDDDNGHGTHVAGIIASETNNREGVAGITWYNKIMPIKAMGAEGYGTTFDIAKGIIWAADHGADVINLSLGNYQPSSLMKEAVKYAYEKNAVIISAAGNDNSSHPSFPAAYPEVLGVSAVSYTGQRAPFSNYGDYIDVSAPGVQIPSTYFNQQYAALSGTSMASPHVAGLAGLILSANPELRNKEVMDIIKNTAYDLGAPGKDIDFGSGLIDVKKALEAVNGK
ncbi:peptidase S8/S53 subtilisin kexin sedolisin [Bacillus methanolicus PB1]|uniref:Peptidase S8/S53 subtilisin kexin sedolisin n=1 Tax=Bacillus methanolicus PB1 TaxID=997296 RepID=I3E090_BACMT|nr:S8 family peptidase [Bacillus methanolicus]EIJ79911.1 peptidase S8/S53 subtilisin kexin sedolisin [Bacillus methanolicus PB1]